MPEEPRSEALILTAPEPLQSVLARYDTILAVGYEPAARLIDDIGLDSIDILELVAAIEEAAGIFPISIAESLGRRDSLLRRDQ
jgi:hypothetical protein